jgi:hypothetical protein
LQKRPNIAIRRFPVKKGFAVRAKGAKRPAEWDMDIQARLCGALEAQGNIMLICEPKGPKRSGKPDASQGGQEAHGIIT